jgi:pyrroloquinoline-quinone synthase
VTRDALVRICRTEEQQRIALDAAREAADAINLLLDGIYERWCSPAETAAE